MTDDGTKNECSIVIDPCFFFFFFFLDGRVGQQQRTMGRPRSPGSQAGFPAYASSRKKNAFTHDAWGASVWGSVTPALRPLGPPGHYPLKTYSYASNPEGVRAHPGSRRSKLLALVLYFVQGHRISVWWILCLTQGGSGGWLPVASAPCGGLVAILGCLHGR